MNSETATRNKILAALTETAPEVDAEAINDDVALRDQVDLDSMDWLTFLQRIHRAFQIEIPETDYKRLRSVRDMIDYVGRRVGVVPEQGQAPA